MSLASADVDTASRAIVNVAGVQREARTAAAAASSAIDSTVYAENAANMVAFYDAKFLEWAYGPTGLLAVGESRTMESWLDEGDSLAASFAFWAKASQYTTARGMLASAPSLVTELYGEYFQMLWKKLGELGTGAKWVLYGGGALLALYLVARATGGTADLVKALKA